MISQDAQPFNPERLKQLLGDDVQAIADVVRIACETIPRATARFTDTNLPPSEARSIAHQIKGASTTAGADELAVVAAGIEAELAGAWTPKARMLAASLPAATQRFLAAASASLPTVRSK